MSKSPRTVPAVKSLTFTRSGVAYVTRVGRPNGPFRIEVDADHVDDVLAALTTRGPVRGVTFDAPPDPSRLGKRGLDFDRADAYLGFVQSRLIGQEVQLYLKDRTDAEPPMLGRVLGTTVPVDYALVIDVGGGVETVRMDNIRRIFPTDPAVKADMDYYAASARTNPAKRTLRFATDAKARGQVEVGYLVPAAIWSTKYVLDVATAGGSGELTPWGVLHNPLSEELKGVAVTLTTGKPVSFKTTLNAPRYAERSTVNADNTVAAPVQYAAAQTANVRSNVTKGVSRSAMASLESLSSTRGFNDSEESVGAALYRVEESAPQADVADAGEETTFTVYGVNLPPSGAMTVPLTRRSVPALQRRVWREGTGPNPDMAIRMTNDSGVVLEKGPVSVRVDGAFVGQAIVPYTPKGGEVNLGFAKDQRIRVSHGATATSAGKAKISPPVDGSGVVVVEQKTGQRLRFSVVSLHTKPVEVVVEVSKRDGHTVVASSCPQRQHSENHWRFTVTAAPVATTELTVDIERPVQTTVQVQTMRNDLFVSWTGEGLLTPEFQRQLSTVMDLRAAYREAEAELARLRQEGETLAKTETQLIEKIRALGTDAPQVKQRYTDDLDARSLEARELGALVAPATRKLDGLREALRVAVAACGSAAAGGASTVAAAS